MDLIGVALEQFMAEVKRRQCAEAVEKRAVFCKGHQHITEHTLRLTKDCVNI